MKVIYNSTLVRRNNCGKLEANQIDTIQSVRQRVVKYCVLLNGHEMTMSRSTARLWIVKQEADCLMCTVINAAVLRSALGNKNQYQTATALALQTIDHKWPGLK